MSRINDHLLEREEMHPEEIREFQSDIEKDEEYQEWCDKQELKLEDDDNDKISF